MADQYLTQAIIASDPYMLQRVTAAAASENRDTYGFDAAGWTSERRYAWGSAPGWAEKWDSAVAGGIEEPGKDPAVILDADILSEVQRLLSLDPNAVPAE